MITWDTTELVVSLSGAMVAVPWLVSIGLIPVSADIPTGALEFSGGAIVYFLDGGIVCQA